MRDHEEEKKISPNNEDEFDLIYGLAKSKNKKELEKLICIDVWRARGLETPVCLLAKEGDKEAVEFLLKHGANLDWAVRGAAIGGDKAWVADLIAQGANRGWAVEGAAIAGDKTWVEELIGQGASIDSALCGAAIIGDKTWVEKLTAQGGNRDRAVLGAAWGGYRNKEWVNELLAQGANRNYALWAATVSGDKNKDWLKELIAQGADRNWAAYGAAMAGDKQLLKELLDEGANRDWAVLGATSAGNVKLVDALISWGSNRDWAVQGAAVTGHIKLVERLVAQGASYNWAVMGARKGNLIPDEKKLLRFLSFFNDDTIRKKFAKEAYKFDFKLNVSAITKKAKQINKNMREKDLNYEQAYALTQSEIKGLFKFQSEETSIPDDVMSIMEGYASESYISPKDIKDLYQREIKHINLIKIKELIENYDATKGLKRKFSGDQEDIKALKHFYQSCLNEDKDITRNFTPEEIKKLYEEVIAKAKTKPGSASHDAISFIKNSIEMKKYIETLSKQSLLQNQSLFQNTAVETKQPTSANDKTSRSSRGKK